MRPDDCRTLEDVRFHIDRLDQQIVPMLAERARYVKAAARFKKTEADVKAPDRVAKVIARVRALASSAGADPDALEAVYRTVIDLSIRAEMDAHRNAPPST